MILLAPAGGLAAYGSGAVAGATKAFAHFNLHRNRSDRGRRAAPGPGRDDENIRGAIRRH
jgi:hypothetical protein